ncbi:hypothetical protein QNN88_13085 [Citrobacter sp. ANG330]|uniref:hypothetical protein n=1 Tax=Citrobacter sp. ANG330 TaxID=3048142 RepID=UPI0039C111EE
MSCLRALVFGEQSLPDSDLEYVSDNGIPVAIVPDAGHSMFWENPAALATVLHDILSQ